MTTVLDTQRFMEGPLELAKPQWFPAEVLWTSIKTGTLETAFPIDTKPRRFVFLLNKLCVPFAEFNQVLVRYTDFDSELLIPEPRQRIVFRFVDKRIELLAQSTHHSPTFLNELLYDIEWCYQAEYLKALNDAAQCPLYRLVTKQEVQGVSYQDFVKMRWVTPVRVLETEHWQGCDLDHLRKFLKWNKFTRYDCPTYQKQVDGQWVDCGCPL